LYGRTLKFSSRTPRPWTYLRKVAERPALPATRNRVDFERRHGVCDSLGPREPTEGAAVERVGVIGGGQMGAGIAEVAALAGCDVVVHEVSPEAAEAARSRIEKSLDRAVSRGKLGQEAAGSALSRITFSTDWSEPADREIVIEAVTENEDLRKEIVRNLDEVVAAADAILASNTSSIPITRLASATARPDHVVGLRFFNPVAVMGRVELVTTPRSDAGVEQRAEEFA